MTTERVLPEGVYVQVYRAKVEGKTRKERLAILAHKLDSWKSCGVVGVVWHGFVGEMGPKTFAGLAELCHEREMLAMAAFGLGQDSSHNPQRAGQWIGNVAKQSDCDGIILDPEGKFEDEVSDKAAARTIGVELRKLAPAALVGSQTWPVPTAHWSLFPHEELAEFTDFVAPQWYWCDFRKQYGDKAYEKCCEWFEKSWQKLEARLAPQGLLRPRISTIQGYAQRYDDVLDWFTKQRSCLVWAEPFPEDNVLAAIKSANEGRCVAAAK